MRPTQLLALLLLGAGLSFLALYQRQFAATASGGEPIKILTFAKAIERDKVITDEMLVVREVPQGYVEDRAVKDLERSKVLGLHLAHAVGIGETMLWTDLVTTGDHKVELSSLVPVGNRAVSFRVEGDSSAALILPGDYVDIIGVVSQTPRPPGEGGNFRDSSRYTAYSASRVSFDGANPTPDHQLGSIVLVQHVLVLASGTFTSRDDMVAQPKTDGHNTILTLSLTVPETQLVALAADKGHISVALRNPDDARTAPSIPDLSSNSLLNGKERDEIKGRRPGTGSGALP